jgi:nucleoside-diphosphate-sugar epimerase
MTDQTWHYKSSPELYTYADVDDLVEEFGYKPSMSVKQGVDNFAVWYKQYNKANKD